MSTILCSGEIVDEIVNEFGTSITLSVVTETITDNEYGTPNDAEQNYTTIALVENVTSGEERVKEGLFRGGDLYVHFQLDDQSYAAIGNYITYSGTKYKITRIDKEQRGDTQYVTGARAELVE